MPGPLRALYEFDRRLTRDELLDCLAAMPVDLESTLTAVSPGKLVVPPAPGEWSAFQVFCHMRDAALVYSIRFRWMVFDDDPFLPNYDEDSWVARAADTVADLPAMLREFAGSRSDLVRTLQRLPSEGWARTGRHEVIGPVSLEPYVRHQLKHEQMHHAQLLAALSPAPTPSR